MEGKVAIVTGGAGGIGSAICKAFMRENCAVAIADSDYQKAQSLSTEITSHGIKSMAVMADVTSQESVESSVKNVVDHLGHVDFLVHCAGNNIKAPLLEMSLAQWQSSLDTHLTGAFLFCQSVGKQLVRQRKGGRVVLMSSVAAISPAPERGAYSPAKAGLVNLAQMLSLEWAQYNINVNAICPGVADTPMTKMVYEREPLLKKQRLNRTPMGRHVMPEEIADLVVFLCSDKSTYINGIAVPIDGGFLNSSFLPERE